MQPSALTRSPPVLAALAGLCLGLGAARLCAATPSVKTPGIEHDVVFDEYSPLAHNEALARRLLTPLTSAGLMRKAAQSGAKLRDFPIELAREKYVLFVPPSPPPKGYALLVFVEPWEYAGVPRAWIPVLQRHGFIFVTAEHSGNTESVYERRIPLALVALHNVMRAYPVDPDRVYIGGMSGGSRIAERMALAYPELFHAALLHSSSDPIGTKEVPLPAPDLFRRFQESTRLVFITGQYDAPNIEKDEITRASLRDWCVFDIVTKPFPFAGHELAGASDFEPALTALEEHASPKEKLLSSCREHKSLELSQQLQQVQTLLEGGKVPAARKLLEDIDAHFGGLAAPQSLELASHLSALN